MPALPTQGILLASASPRRLELLQQMGLPVTAVPVDIDEQVGPGELPREYVTRLSAAKCARACALHRDWLQQDSQQRVVLAADTIVVIGARILGKPADEQSAIAMLQALSGRTHQVMTSVSITRQQRTLSRLSTTAVTFRTLSAAEIQAYVHSGEGRDKAGSYGIQGIGGIFAQHISGSYSAVVGLPIAAVEELLVELGIATWPLREHD